MKAVIGGVVCICVIMSGWGCGPKGPSDAEMRKDFAGKPGKKFDPNDLPPNIRAGMEKFMKNRGTQAPAAGAAPQTQ